MTPDALKTLYDLAMMIDSQSTGSASPTSLALHNSGEEISMTRHEQYAAHTGMTTFTLRHSKTGQTVEYTAADLRCAQMLAAADHSDDDEDTDAWEWIA